MIGDEVEPKNFYLQRRKGIKVKSGIMIFGRGWIRPKNNENRRALGNSGYF